MSLVTEPKRKVLCDEVIHCCTQLAKPCEFVTAVVKPRFRIAVNRQGVVVSRAGLPKKPGKLQVWLIGEHKLGRLKLRKDMPMGFVQAARKLNKHVWIDIEKPFWWDVPTWLATGQMNSIGIANNHMCRSGMLSTEAWGKPQDLNRLPDPLGNGLWSQEIYHEILNTGIRLPPTAGSASGVLSNSVGYNRVYVHLGDQELTRDARFAALSEG